MVLESFGKLEEPETSYRRSKGVRPQLRGLRGSDLGAHLLPLLVSRTVSESCLKFWGGG